MKRPRYLEMQCTGEVRRISDLKSSQLLISHVCACVGVHASVPVCI